MTPRRWPLLAMFDTGDHGHIGYAVAIGNLIAAGPETLGNGWVIPPPSLRAVERRCAGSLLVPRGA